MAEKLVYSQSGMITNVFVDDRQTLSIPLQGERPLRTGDPLAIVLEFVSPDGSYVVHPGFPNPFKSRVDLENGGFCAKLPLYQVTAQKNAANHLCVRFSVRHQAAPDGPFLGDAIVRLCAHITANEIFPVAIPSGGATADAITSLLNQLRPLAAQVSCEVLAGATSFLSRQGEADHRQGLSIVTGLSTAELASLFDITAPNGTDLVAVFPTNDPPGLAEQIDVVYRGQTEAREHEAGSARVPKQYPLVCGAKGMPAHLFRDTLYHVWVLGTRPVTFSSKCPPDAVGPGQRYVKSLAPTFDIDGQLVYRKLPYTVRPQQDTESLWSFHTTMPPAFLSRCVSSNYVLGTPGSPQAAWLVLVPAQAAMPVTGGAAGASGAGASGSSAPVMGGSAYGHDPPPWVAVGCPFFRVRDRWSKTEELEYRATGRLPTAIPRDGGGAAGGTGPGASGSAAGLSAGAGNSAEALGAQPGPGPPGRKRARARRAVESDKDEAQQDTECATFDPSSSPGAESASSAVAGLGGLGAGRGPVSLVGDVPGARPGSSGLQGPSRRIKRTPTAQIGASASASGAASGGPVQSMGFVPFGQPGGQPLAVGVGMASPLPGQAAVGSGAGAGPSSAAGSSSAAFYAGPLSGQTAAVSGAAGPTGAEAGPGGMPLPYLPPGMASYLGQHAHDDEPGLPGLTTLLGGYSGGLASGSLGQSAAPVGGSGAIGSSSGLGFGLSALGSPLGSMPPLPIPVLGLGLGQGLGMGLSLGLGLGIGAGMGAGMGMAGATSYDLPIVGPDPTAALPGGSAAVHHQHYINNYSFDNSFIFNNMNSTSGPHGPQDTDGAEP